MPPEPQPERQSPIESRIERSFEDTQNHGRPLSRRARQTRRSVEAYLRAGVLPRYMERLREIERETEDQRARLDRAYSTLQRECAGDQDRFARLWTARAGRWRFDKLNELIGQHNEWYPIESGLPMDPRTRDYQRIRGRTYRRDPVDAAWILREYPPGPPARRG